MKHKNCFENRISAICKRAVAAVIIFAVIGSALVVSMALPVNAKCTTTPDNITVRVDENKEFTAKILNYDYTNNIYISMRDLSVALNESSKPFALSFGRKDDEMNIIIKSKKTSVGPEDGTVPFSDNVLSGELSSKYSRKRLCVTIDDHDFYFYVVPFTDSDGNQDVFMNLGELALSYNIDMSLNEGGLYIRPGNEFDFAHQDLFDKHFFDMTDACLVGDVTTGDVYFGHNEDVGVAIASTTKLMTYIIVMDAIEKGEISESDMIRFSREASILSNSGDGVIPVAEGQTAPIDEVLKGMLIVSSNECALALAEHVCGSEADFVDRMNKKAKALGLSDDTYFFNSNGLPTYGKDIIAGKRQNHMRATDMFALSAYILDKYPQILEITSLKKADTPSLRGKELSNTNVLLYNVEGTVGLKTGTTTKAGSCLVAANEVCDIKGDTHYVVSIVFDAESAQTQNYTSLVLMKYGLQEFNARSKGITPNKEDRPFPTTVEELVEAVVDVAR